MNAFVNSRITDEQLKRKIHIDAKVGFEDINLSLLDMLSMFSPFGLGNPRPLFLTEMAEIVTKPRKIHGKHCKFLVKQDGRIFESIGWGKGEWADEMETGDKLNIVYSLQISEYLGVERLTLFLEDAKRV